MLLETVIEYISKRSEIAMGAGEYEQKRNDLKAWDLEFLTGIDEPAMLPNLLQVVSFLQGKFGLDRISERACLKHNGQFERVLNLQEHRTLPTELVEITQLSFFSNIIVYARQFL
jgi:hypothetical protein